MLLDEPSLGLAPMLVEEIFAIIQRLNKDEGVTVLLVQQNAAMAPRLALGRATETSSTTAVASAG